MGFNSGLFYFFLLLAGSSGLMFPEAFAACCALVPCSLGVKEGVIAGVVGPYHLG